MPAAFLQQALFVLYTQQIGLYRADWSAQREPSPGGEGGKNL